MSKDFSVEKAQITGLAPTILFALGLPIPKVADGRVLEELFEPEMFSRLGCDFFDSQKTAKTEKSKISEAEAGQISEVLKNLGYLG